MSPKLEHCSPPIHLVLHQLRLHFASGLHGGLALRGGVGFTHVHERGGASLHSIENRLRSWLNQRAPSQRLVEARQEPGTHMGAVPKQPERSTVMISKMQQAPLPFPTTAQKRPGVPGSGFPSLPTVLLWPNPKALTVRFMHDFVT